jgi:uncharacterized surface protein with fasciclin (FAS1) repeats
MTSFSMKTTVSWARQAVAVVMAASVLVGGPAMAGGNSVNSGSSGNSSNSRIPDFVKPVRVSGTIVDVAVSNPAFSTLVTALTAAGLVSTLQGPGPFTVFAPTNDAFAKVPAPVLNLLLSNTAALTDVLLYHVTGGIQDLRYAFVPRDIKTVQGQQVFAERERDRLFINNSRVIGQPIVTDNGVIYVVDSVLLPQYR